jgi:hypothetical protein
MATAGPNFADTVRILVSTGAMKPQEIDSYMKNYYFFERQRSMITEKFPHSWVASLDDQLYSNSSLKDLEAQMDSLSNGGYAYIEQVP